MPSAWKIAAIALFLAGVLAAILAAYGLGRRDEAAGADLKAKTEIIEQLNERGEIDGVVEKLPADELCAALGGVWRNDRCE